MTPDRRFDAPTTDFRRGLLYPVAGPAGTDQRRQHEAGGASVAAFPAGVPGGVSRGAAAASSSAATLTSHAGGLTRASMGLPRYYSAAPRPSLSVGQSRVDAGAPRGRVYRSGSRAVRGGPDRDRLRAAVFVAAGLLCAAALPTAAVSRPVWGPPATLTFLGLLLLGAGLLMCAVPSRSLPPADEDEAAV